MFKYVYYIFFYLFNYIFNYLIFYKFIYDCIEYLKNVWLYYKIFLSHAGNVQYCRNELSPVLIILT